MCKSRLNFCYLRFAFWESDPQTVYPSPDWPRYVVGPAKIQRHMKYLSAHCHRYGDIRPQKIEFRKICGRITPKPEVRCRKWRHRWTEDLEFYESCKFGDIRISQARTVSRWKKVPFDSCSCNKYYRRSRILCWELLTHSAWSESRVGRQKRTSDSQKPLSGKPEVEIWRKPNIWTCSHRLPIRLQYKLRVYSQSFPH